jgi:MYXO-CTERM domain-containing protein
MKHAAKLLAISATILSLGAAAEPLALLNSNPDPSTAWLLALGFLGAVVLRRTRSGPIL